MAPRSASQTLGTKMSTEHLHYHKGLLTRTQRPHQTRRCCKFQARHQRLPQGSVSGPNLWNIIISGLIELLSKAPNLEIVTIADDILLMFHGT